MNKLTHAFLVTLAATAALAQPTPPKPAAAPKPIALKAARIFDGTSDNVATNGVVIVEGDRITAAGSGIAIPANAQVIDLGDATLLPGFIDAHTHVTFESSDNYYMSYFQNLMRHPTEQAFYAAKNASAILNAGFTTIRDLGSEEYLDIGLRNAINAGLVPGPRIFCAVHGIGSTGGHADQDPIPPSRAAQKGPIDGVCNGPEECRAAVRYQIKYGADVIKFMPSGGVLSLSDPVDAPELSQDEMNAIVEEAHHWGRKAAAHCHGDAAARMAIQAGVDSIEHGSFLKPETFALMHDKGVYFVPTLLAGEWTGGKGHVEKFPPSIAEKAKAALEASHKKIKYAVAAGTKIAFGTDSAVSPHGVNPQEFGLMVDYGMTPAAALRAATQTDAALLGMSDKLGTLEKGKYADVVAVPGNPLTDIHVTERVLFVMKAGNVVKNTK